MRCQRKKYNMMEEVNENVVPSKPRKQPKAPTTQLPNKGKVTTTISQFVDWKVFFFG
jgi:hypothetical protein